jgi:hypothetical protein
MVTDTSETKSDVGTAQFGQSFGDLRALKAQLSNGEFWITLGYPRPLLLSLAGELAAALQAYVSSVGRRRAAAVPVVEVAGAAEGEIERRERPTDSRIELQELPTGFTMIVPPRGLWRGSAGLFFFSLIWCGVTAVFSAVFIGEMLSGKHELSQSDMIIFALLLSLFWLSGLGLLTYGIHLGRRSTALGVSNSRLIAIQTGLFGARRREWAADELATVRVGPSGMEVNERPIMQVQFVPREGKPYGVLTGYSEPELEWVATMLRRSLRPPATQPSINSD